MLVAIQNAPFECVVLVGYICFNQDLEPEKDHAQSLQSILKNFREIIKIWKKNYSLLLVWVFMVVRI